MLKIIRWFLGYVFFEVKGKSPERFMTLASKYGINLWNAKKNEETLTAHVAASEYKSLRHSARKSESLLKIKKRCGFPFFLRKFKLRLGIVVGIICFFIILQTMSMFIWKIDIEGINQLNENEIKYTLKKLGLDEGKIKNNIDIRSLEQNTMEEINRIAWISINIKGSIATVSIKERIVAPDIVNKNKPCNIKSTCDGQVFRMEIYDGTAEINVGDAVFKGQLLINGIVEDIYGGCTLHHANGKIFAYTRKTIKEEIPLQQTIYNETGKKTTRASAKIFGINIPLTFTLKPSGKYKKEYQKEDLMFCKMPLPIKIHKQKFIEQVPENIILTENQAKEQAIQRINEREQNEFKDITIIDKNITSTTRNNIYITEISYYCEENISVEEEIIVN